MTTLQAPDQSRSRGQVLPIFVIFLVAMLLMASLLIDASTALLMRRQYQNATDAAALAAANVIPTGSPRGCSAIDEPVGSPRSVVVEAARASVHANLPDYDLSRVVVSCPGGTYGNWAVKIQLHGDSAGFFSQVVGIESFPVDTSGVAVNGQFEGGKWSVVQLNPYNATWNRNKGCPSLLFSGGPTAIFDGSIHVNSKCPASLGGAMGTNGNAANLTFNNDGAAYLAGGFSQGPLIVTPTPRENRAQIPDPLAGLAEPSGLSTVHSPNTLVLGSGDNVILGPGIYVGGIQLKSNARAFLKPGIYVMQGGGLDLGAQSSAYTVKYGFTLPANPATWTDASWATTDCLVGQCGVLIFNTKGNTCTCSSIGAFTVGAGANLKIRPYDPDVAGNNVVDEAYKNLLFWQAAVPVPASNYQQPVVALGGGGSVDMSGTVYAPSAKVQMTGGSGGTGGDSITLTIQFISYDLEIQGNSSFHFYYQSNLFAKPLDYGLVE